MTIKLSHLGEPLVESLANADPDWFYALCFPEPVPVGVRKVATELKLAPWGGREFDPISRVDLGIWVGDSLVTPVEIKLGLEGLGRKSVADRLGSWERSRHGDPRWKGSMMAFLDRHYPEDYLPAGTQTEALKVIRDASEYELTKDWIVIARRKVVSKWEAEPAVFQQARLVVFEDLVESFGEARFNETVSGLLPGNFYQEWFRNPKA